MGYRGLYNIVLSDNQNPLIFLLIMICCHDNDAPCNQLGSYGSTINSHSSERLISKNGREKWLWQFTRNMAKPLPLELAKKRALDGYVSNHRHEPDIQSPHFKSDI
jgi:hypothetical protein